MSDEKKQLVKYEDHGPVTLGTLFNTSMLDGLTVADFGNQVVAHVQKHSGIRLMLNFENVQYLSSAALTELIRIRDAAAETGGKVRICNLSKDIEKVFKITKFDKMFEIHTGESLKESLRKFRRAAEIEQQEAAWEERQKNF